MTSPALGEVSKSQLQVRDNHESKMGAEVTDEKSGGSKLKTGKESAMQVNAPAEEQQDTDKLKEEMTQREKAISAANPDMHWTDVMIQAEKSEIVELKDLIQARMNKLMAEHIGKSDTNRPNSSGQPAKLLAGIDSHTRISAASPTIPNDSAAAIAESNAVEENEDHEEGKEGLKA